MLVGALLGKRTALERPRNESAKCRLRKLLRRRGRRFGGADRTAGRRDLDQPGADPVDRPTAGPRGGRPDHLFGAFAVSSVALIPDQSAAAFAAEVLVSGLLMLLAQLSIQLRSWT